MRMDLSPVLAVLNREIEGTAYHFEGYTTAKRDGRDLVLRIEMQIVRMDGAPMSDGDWDIVTEALRRDRPGP